MYVALSYCWHNGHCTPAPVALVILSSAFAHDSKHLLFALPRARRPCATTCWCNATPCHRYAVAKKERKNTIRSTRGAFHHCAALPTPFHAAQHREKLLLVWKEGYMARLFCVFLLRYQYSRIYAMLNAHDVLYGLRVLFLVYRVPRLRRFINGASASLQNSILKQSLRFAANAHDDLPRNTFDGGQNAPAPPGAVIQLSTYRLPTYHGVLPHTRYCLATAGCAALSRAAFSRRFAQRPATRYLLRPARP